MSRKTGGSGRFAEGKALKAAELAHLSQQERELEEQKRKMEEEVARLQGIVAAAQKDLDVANKQSRVAEDAVKGAAEAFSGQVSKPDSLWTHAAAPSPDDDDDADDVASTSSSNKPRRTRKRVIKIKRDEKSEKLGLFFSNGTGEITRVFPGYAGSKSGLRAGMTILKVGKTPVATLAEVDAALAAAGQDLTVSVEEEIDTDDENYEVCDDISDEEEEEAGVEGEAEDGFMIVSSPSKKAAAAAKLPASPASLPVAEKEPVQPPAKPAAATRAAAPAPTKPAAAKEEEKTAFNDPYAGLDLPEIDIEEFKKFCEKYAAEHPEMMAPDLPDDEGEELLRMREERRMRELNEDPTAIQELLMRTMQQIDAKRPPAAKQPAKPTMGPEPPPKSVETGLGTHLLGDDWKKDYEQRVTRTQEVLDTWAQRDDAVHDAKAGTPHSLGVAATSPGAAEKGPQKLETFAEYLKRTQPQMFSQRAT